MRGLLLAVLLAPACSVRLQFSGTSYACRDGETCPGGYACIDFECVPSAADGAASSDGPGQDAAPALRCNSVTLLADDFEDGERADAWAGSFMDSGTILSEASGQLTVGLASGMSGQHAAAYGSRDWYDLRDGRVSVEAVSVPNPTTSAFMSLTASFGTDDELEIGVVGDVLRCRTIAAGVETILRTRSYNPNPHRFWAIRESGGTVTFETSGSGDSWDVQAEAPAPFDVAFVRLELQAGTSEATASPGQAVFDSFNGGEATGALCPASSLIDDFEDGLRAHAWERGYVSPGCTLTESDGQVAITPSATTTGACGYESSARYDLRDDSVTLDVAEVTAGAAQTFLGVEDLSGAEALVVVESGMLIARAGTSTNVAAVPYDAAAHRVWRIRTEGTTLHWEASANGELFTEIAAAEAPIDASSVLINVGAGTYVVTASPGQARFAGLNVP
jgi:hypothetical protein